MLSTILFSERLEVAHLPPLPNASWPLSSLNVKRTGNNVGQDVNNPGNIMAESPGQEEYAKRLGAIGKYTSPNGRTYAVFPDMNVGIMATHSDLSSKLAWGSSWVRPNTTLAQFASGWTVWPNAPLNQWAVNNYVTLTGYPSNTPISQIPKEKLIAAIVRNEGVNPSISAKIA